MEPIQKNFTKEDKIENGYEYKFDISEDGLYLIEIIASAKSWWQNFLKIKFGDDDLTMKVDDIEFPKKNNKKGLFDGEVAWNGNNLKGFSKTNIFIINLSQGSHILTFLIDESPTLKSIKIIKVDSNITFTPAGNNPAEDGDRRQWMTVVLVDLPLKKLVIRAVAKSYPDQSDQDDIKLIINSEVQMNEDENDKNHKYWYWSGKILNGQEKEFNKEVNKPKGLHYVELWADRMPKVKSINLNLGLDSESGSEEQEKRIPTVDDPEWTGDFNDDTEQMILARALFGESRSLPEKGRIAVGWVIRNRVDSKKNSTYSKVILIPKHFSAFNENDKNYRFVKNPFEDKTQTDEWYKCYEIAGKVMNGELDDPTDGANHYFSNFIDYPEWTKDKNAEFKIKIGNTLFYDLKNSNSNNSGFIKLTSTILIFVVGIFFFGLLYITSRLDERCSSEKILSGTMEAEQYKHFFINQKTNEIQAAYFSASGNFLRMGTITNDGYPKKQLDVFPDNDSELMGYLQDLSILKDQNENGKSDYEKDMALMIKNNEYDEPREVFRTDKPILEWKWLDKKHADIFFNCGSGCQYYNRVNIDTRELEDKGTVFYDVSNKK